MKKALKSILTLLAIILIGFIYYYVTIPAFNIHSSGFWAFLMIGIFLFFAILAATRVKTVEEAKHSKLIKLGGFCVGVTLVIFIIGSILSSPIVNSKKYQKILTVEDREFSQDIQEVSFNQIPLLDKDSAELLGNRKMGSMVDMVSQFEVGSAYTQINYQSVPTRVTPLIYASPIKWIANQSDGIPAYLKINMTDQNVELVKLDQGIKYSESEYFNRYIYRHLRFSYPTYIFDSFNFEIDDEGVPYWICPVKKYTIGLFGGETIGGAVLCNAITGETTDYDISEVPSWVDRVFSAELLVSQYDYYGSLKHGYFNTLLSQKDCSQTTEGYNYIAMDDDVWVYTGITSVSGDQSIIGFVLMNQRTQETRYYSVEGAKEISAMSSAEGQVQNLGYQATFPLLLNIGNEPTYFIALKDDSGLVKKYALVNIKRYQIVAIGDSVSECEKQYISLLSSNGISSVAASTLTITGSITKIAQGVVEGNSHYYIMLDSSNEIFDVPVVDYINIIKFNEGDQITFEYAEGTDVNTVFSIQ
ncbi:MAG: CvpA family protein [Lachnotalea sp.]